jgi:hypothetical protein
MREWAVIVVHVLAVVAGVALGLFTLFSAITTVVLPRSESSIVVRAEFLALSRVFGLIAHDRRSYASRDRVLAYYAPIGLILLPGVWVLMIIVAFMLIYWGSGLEPLQEAFIVSGSSLLTLGFDRPPGLPHIVLSFVEAALGLGIVALMISYLPTFYNAFNRREAPVAMLEARAGEPPSPSVWLARYHIIGLLPQIETELSQWEAWFADIEESHTSNPALVFFRSPQPGRSWITAAGCILDTAAVVASTLDRPRSPQAQLLIRTGYLALRHIADYFGIPYDPDPMPDEPISVSRDEFEVLLRELEAAGIPLQADRDQAFRDWAGWRVNYDRALIGLATLVTAPEARWSSDRVSDLPRPRVRRLSPLATNARRPSTPPRPKQP